MSLNPTENWGKVIFSQACVIPSAQGGGVRIWGGVCIQGSVGQIPPTDTVGYGQLVEFFFKCTGMAIMPVLTPEALLCANKNLVNSVTPSWNRTQASHNL